MSDAAAPDEPLPAAPPPAAPLPIASEPVAASEPAIASEPATASEPVIAEPARGTAGTLPSTARTVASRGVEAAESMSETARAVASRGAEAMSEAASRGAEAMSEAASRGAEAMSEAASRGAEAAEAATGKARVVASRSVEAVSDTARVVASRSAAAADAAVRGVRGGWLEASRRFEAERADWDRVVQRSDLPDIAGSDPMSDLAVRLDSEATFWRDLALRGLRPGAPRVIALVAASVAVLGSVALAGIGALGELVGTSSGGAHLWAAAGALGVGVVLALASAAWLDGSAKRAVREALLRADESERRLQRVAAILALRNVDAPAYRDALARFERG